VPRKHREIRSSLESKGFEVEDGRKHIFLVYVDKEGKTTTARTMLSHGSGGDDISDNLFRKDGPPSLPQPWRFYEAD